MKINISKEENTIKKSKISAFKKFFKDDYFFYILISVILVAGITLLIVLPLHFTPTHTTQANVTAVGYKGVTIEYRSGYGQVVTKKVNVDDVSEYQIGDIVTIEIKGLIVKIVEKEV